MTPLIAKLVWLAGMIGWYAIRYPFQRRAARLAVVRSAVSAGDRFALAAAAAGLFVVPAIWAATGAPAFANYGFQPPLAWAGIVVLVAALVLFRLTHGQLGRNWSVTLETRPRHVLVTGGPYARVRHPMYSSFLLLAIAQALLLPNWIAGLAGLAGVGFLFAARIGREERLMLETFGADYHAYMARTARIVPWIY